VRLLPLELWIQPAPGPLLARIRQELAAAARSAHGQSARPLRWAITGVHPVRGLRIEALLVCEAAPALDSLQGGSAAER